jgi:hypothetical protein
MQNQKGTWRDQLFFHVQGNRFLAIVPTKDFKYIDPDKLSAEMMTIMQSVEVTEAIYTCCRQMELEDGPVDTFNINYIGPAAWDGASLCLPYVYSRRLNESWVIESDIFDRISDSFNDTTLTTLRDNFYGVSDIAYKERVRILTSKGYRVMDSNEIIKSRIAATIATVGVSQL